MAEDGAGRDAVELDGRRFAWRAAGSGPLLLLVNGYAATSADWDPTFLADLAAHYEVIAPDNRGMGDSEPGEEEPTIAAMAADLEALLDALGAEAALVVGWSMGGFIAQSLAAQAPARVRGMALIASDPGGPEAVLAEPGVWSQLTDHSGPPRRQASRLISLLFPPQTAAQIDAEFGDVVAAARAAMSVEALRRQEEAMAAWHSERPAPVDPAQAPPTLIAHGSEDVVIPPGNAPLLARRWGAEAPLLLEGCGHGLMAQEPERLAAELHAFFSQAG